MTFAPNAIRIILAGFILTGGFFLLPLTQRLSAQTTAGGGSAVPFLLIAPNARYAGMGEAGTAISNDVNAIFFNIGEHAGEH
jgi:hypothetical protein